MNNPSYYCYSTQPFEMDKVESQIKGFLDFEAGWDFGEGEPFSNMVVNNSIEVYRLGKSRGLKTEVFPEVEGEITLSFQNDENFLDITMKTDGSFELNYEKGIGANYTSEELGTFTEIGDIKERIRWLSNLSKNGLSESSTYFTLAKEKSDFGRGHSRNMEAVYRYLMTFVENSNIRIPLVNT